MAQAKKTLAQLLAEIPDATSQEEQKKPSLEELLASIPDAKEEPKGIWEKANTGIMPSWVPRFYMEYNFPGSTKKYPVLTDIQSEVFSGLTSPASIALTAGTLGTGALYNAGRVGLGAGLGAATRIGSIPYAAEGLMDLTGSDNTAGERAFGALELAGGLLGMRGLKPKPRKSRFIGPEVLPPEQKLLTGRIGDAPIEAGPRQLGAAGYSDALAAGEMLPGNVPPRQLALPAVGETSATSPRFYQGEVGLADMRRRYPIEFDDPLNQANTFRNAMGEIPPDIAASRGTGLGQLGTIDSATIHPTFRELIPERLRRPLWKPTIGGGISRTPVEEIIPPGGGAPGSGGITTPPSKLHQPTGGRVVTPPELESIRPPFRASTLVGEDAKLVKQIAADQQRPTVYRVLYPEGTQAGESARQAFGRINKNLKITPDELSNIIWQVDKVPDPNQRKWIAEVLGIFKTIMSTEVLPITSALFRQGMPLIGSKGWREAWEVSIKAWGSAHTRELQRQAFKARPLYEMGRKAGLAETSSKNILTAEEAFPSGDLIQRIPIFGRTFGKHVIARSNRAHEAALMHMRGEGFDKLTMFAANMNRNLFETQYAPNLARKLMYSNKYSRWLDPQRNMNLAEKIADYMNNATGRGTLGRFEKISEELAIALFSPRRWSSVINMMDPRNYLFTDPLIRKQYWKSLFSMVGAWGTMATAGSYMGGKVLLDDPTNADFGKIRIGNTRIDIGAGFLQQIVLLSRLWEGKITSSSTGNVTELGKEFRGPTYLSLLEDYGTYKLNPLFSYALGSLGERPDRPFDAKQESIQLILPMAIGDIMEVYKENPELVLAVLPAEILGMGAQAYHSPSMGQLRVIK
jgi:hypothetical protein